MNRPQRWLNLAARARQWALDEQGQHLHHARHAEDEAQALHDRHAQALEAAHAGQSELLRAEAFSAADLARHARFEHALRGQSAQSEAALQQARQQADHLRAAMQHTLSERDAYQHRCDQLLQHQRQEQARADVRQLDEAWLTRSAFHQGNHHED